MFMLVELLYFIFELFLVYALAKNWQSLDTQGGWAGLDLHQARAFKNI